MKYVKLLLLLLCAVPGTPFSSRADHGLGAEIHYTQLATDTYQVTVIMYRDCNGTTFTSPTVTVTDAKKSQNFNLKATTTKDITPVVPGGCTRCSSSSCKFSYGIQECQFTGKIYTSGLHAGCMLKVWFLGYPRPSSITTGASYENSYYEAKINRCAGPNNSTPTFTSPPLLIVPTKEITYYNPGVIDNDVDSAGNRDSLVYSLTPSLKDASSSNTWSGSYDYFRPLDFVSFPKNHTAWRPPTSPGGFHFDSLTGYMYFKPTSTIVSLLTYSVFVYGKSKSGNVYLKGVTNRSIVISTLAVPTKHEPDLSGINGGPSMDTTVIPNAALCFNINCMVGDTSDSIKVSSNNNIPSSTFGVTSGVKNPVATFCWTPDSTYLSTYPYMFVVKAEDNSGSNLSQRAFKAYRVYVKPPIHESIMGTNCNNSVFSVTRKAGSAPITKYQWYGDDSLSSTAATFVHQYKKAGIYKYYLKASNEYTSVMDSGTVTVSAPLLEVHAMHDTSVCTGTSLSIKTLANGGKGKYSYAWSSGDTTSSFTSKISKNARYTILVKDSVSCTAIDSLHIRANALPIVNAGMDIAICKSISSISLSGLKAMPVGGTWSGAGVKADSLYTGMAGVGKDRLTYAYTDSNNCSDSASVNVNIMAGPPVPVISEPVRDSLVASIKNENYDWYKDSVPLSLHSDSIYVNQSGNYTVMVRDSSGCSNISSPYHFIFTAVSGAVSGNENISLYPNPATGVLTLEMKGKGNALAVLRNNTGQVMMSFSLTDLPQQRIMDMHDFPAGIYFLHLSDANGSYVQKVILEK